MKARVTCLLIVGCGSLLLGACSSTFDDVMGSGKVAPDESAVKVHQMLALPPDYQLRPPADGSNIDTGQNNPYALPTVTPGAPTPNIPQQTQVASVDPNAPGPQSITPGAQQQQSNTTYYGISTVNPDGTPKSRQQINRELNERRIAEERKKNPSYGTIWNMGALFEDIFN